MALPKGLLGRRRDAGNDKGRMSGPIPRCPRYPVRGFSASDFACRRTLISGAREVAWFCHLPVSHVHERSEPPPRPAPPQTQSRGQCSCRAGSALQQALSVSMFRYASECHLSLICQAVRFRNGVFASYTTTDRPARRQLRPCCVNRRVDLPYEFQNFELPRRV